MEFKGTRGIWRMCISDDGDLVSDVKHIEPSKLVCKIHKHKSIEGRANALLISKAPEMLDLLNRISGEILRSDFVLDEKWYDQIQKLINEATNI